FMSCYLLHFPSFPTRRSSDLAGAIFGGLVYFGLGHRWPARAVMRVHLIRGTISVFMALAFFWGLARVPLAQGVALAFVAPLIALYLAAALLKEQIERRAILASLLGLAGVAALLAGQGRRMPGRRRCAARSPSSCPPVSTPGTSC